MKLFSLLPKHLVHFACNSPGSSGAYPRFTDPEPIFMKRGGRMPPIPSNPNGGQ